MPVGVNIEMISTSEIRISVVVDQDDVDRAVAAAHTAFGLDAADEAVVYAGTGRWLILRRVAAASTGLQPCAERWSQPQAIRFRLTLRAVPPDR